MEKATSTTPNSSKTPMTTKAAAVPVGDELAVATIEPRIATPNTAPVCRAEFSAPEPMPVCSLGTELTTAVMSDGIAKETPKPSNSKPKQFIATDNAEFEVNGT